MEIPTSSLEWIRVLHHRLQKCCSRDDQVRISRALFRLILSGKLDGKDLRLTEEEANDSFNRFVVPAIKGAKLRFGIGEIQASIEEKSLFCLCFASIAKREIHLTELLNLIEYPVVYGLFSKRCKTAPKDQQLAQWFKLEKKNLSKTQIHFFLCLWTFYVISNQCILGPQACDLLGFRAILESLECLSVCDLLKIAL